MIVRLEVPPPTGNPVDVTVEISAESVALVSTDPAVQGTKSVTFTGVTNANVGTIYIQGLELNGATEIKVSAPAYDDSIPATISVKKSGFRITRNFSSNINIGQTSNLTISSLRLNDNATLAGIQPVRGGVSFSFDLNTSVPTVGTFISPIVLGGGEQTKTSVFTATASGTTNISISQPTGFTEPAGGGDIDITVN